MNEQNTQPEQSDKSTKSLRFVYITMMILNIIVLLGQLWPQGAPPFANIINIDVLILNVLLFFVFIIRKKQ